MGNAVQNTQTVTQRECPLMANMGNPITGCDIQNIKYIVNPAWLTHRLQILTNDFKTRIHKTKPHLISEFESAFCEPVTVLCSL